MRQQGVLEFAFPVAFSISRGFPPVLIHSAHRSLDSKVISAIPIPRQDFSQHFTSIKEQRRTIFPFFVNFTDTTMAKIFRRAAHKVKNSRDGHGSLGLLIFDEKVVYETLQKVILAKADGKSSTSPGAGYISVLDLSLSEDYVF